MKINIKVFIVTLRINALQKFPYLMFYLTP